MAEHSTLQEQCIHKLDNANEKSIEYSDVIANHYNALEEKGLDQRNESRIIHMRNFNNWIKSMLLNEFIVKAKTGKNYQDRLKVLDMCCGKGGDINKWKKANVSHVIFADIADVSIQQCQVRYNDTLRKERSLFSAEFLVSDCTRVRLREKYKDPTIKLDLVSCQFAFHYCFESLGQAECMFKNAGETLRQDGYFIGTIPNAYELVSRWKKADGNKFGNDVYSIEFECDKNNPPLFGAKYLFYLEGVVNCPEFLVYRKLFEKLGLNYGLELVLFETFADFYERFKNDHEGKRLLNQMKAFETYPSRQGTPLRGGDSDYSHASDHLQKSTVTEDQKIGTLSKSEWEAISLYAVFAFKKMKTVWNREGKPEYVKS